MSTAMWKLEKDLCRCCHAEGSFKNLSEPCFQLGQEEIYFDMLQECLDIKIIPMTGELSHVTYTICESCIVRLRDASNFKRQVMDCEERFKDMYSRNLIKGFEVKEEPVTLSDPEDMKQEFHSMDDDDDDDGDDNNDDMFLKFENDTEESELTVSTGADTPKAKSKAKPKPKPKPKAKQPVKKQRPKKVKVALSSAEKQRRYRERLKKIDPEKYELQKRKILERYHEKKKKTSEYSPPEQEAIKKVALTPAEKQKRYRERLKERDPVKYELQRRKNLERCREKYNKISECSSPEWKKAMRERLRYIKKWNTENNIEGRTSKEEAVTEAAVSGEKKKGVKARAPKFFLRDGDYTRDGEAYLCTRCDKKYYKVFSLRFHVKTKHYKIPRFPCQHCPKQFMTLAPLTVHKLEEHNIDDRFKCNACKGTFNTKIQLRKHINNFHMLGEKYKCEFCEYESFSFEGMYKHKFKHRTVKDYHCKFCRKSFLRKTTLDLHERIHTGDRRKVCNVCGQAFVQKASLNYHMTKYHPEVNF